MKDPILTDKVISNPSCGSSSENIQLDLNPTKGGCGNGNGNGNGPKGDPGLSAYEVAVQEGFIGTVSEWIESLKGRDGKSTYEIAVEEGFEGTPAEWLTYILTHDREWVLQQLALMDLQKVTDNGNITTNDIILNKSKLTFLTDNVPNVIAPVGGGYLMGIAKDSLDRIYAMVYGDRLVRFNADLTGMTTLLTIGVGTNPFGSAANNVAIDAEDRIYIADYVAGRILRFEQGGTTGTVVAGGSVGSGLGQLSSGRGIAFDSLNRLYVCDGNNRVLRYTEGSTIGVVVAAGNGTGAGLNQLNGPNDICFDEDDNLYIADTFNHRILKYNLSVSPVGVLVAGGNGQGSALNQLNSPRGVSVDRDGNVYVSDVSNHRVVRWAPGASTGEIVAGGIGQSSDDNGLNGPYDMFYEPEGRYNYIADTFNSRVVRRYVGLNTVDIEARNGEAYRNDKRLLTEDDILDTTPLAVKAEVHPRLDNLENGKVDKNASQTPTRVIFVGSDGSLIGEADMTYDQVNNILNINQNPNVSNEYKLKVRGSAHFDGTGITVDNTAGGGVTYIHLSGGRSALIGHFNGIDYRLSNADASDRPDTSKWFKFRNRNFIHFQCYTVPLTYDELGQPTTWRMINEFNQFVRMPDLPSMSGSYQVVVRNNANGELQLVEKDLLSTRRNILELPLVIGGDASALEDWEEYRTPEGTTGFKVPTGTGPFKSAFKSAFKK